MAFLSEAWEVLLALRQEGGRDDPTFRRMAAVYGEVALLLNCRADYERLLRGLLVEDRLLSCAPHAGPCRDRDGVRLP